MPVLPEVGSKAFCLGVVDHRFRDAVLDRSCGIEIFKLGQDFRAQLFVMFDMGEFQKRRAADQLIGGSVDLCHDVIPFLQKSSGLAG